MADQTEKVQQSKRRGRKVVRLSRVDQERLERGDISTPEEALHLLDAQPLAERTEKPAWATEAPENLSPRDRQFIENLPPHFGKI